MIPCSVCKKKEAELHCAKKAIVQGLKTKVIYSIKRIVTNITRLLCSVNRVSEWLRIGYNFYFQKKVDCIADRIVKHLKEH